MGYGKFGLRLLGTNILMILIILIAMPLIAVFPDSELYQWIVGIIFILLLWVVVYADASNYSQKDLKRDKFNPAKGFLSGLIASIPGLILYIVVMTISNVKWLPYILYGWLSPYIKLIISLEELMPAAAIILILLYPIVTGFSYLDGIRRRRKVLETIEKRQEMRKELSKRSN